MSDDPFGGWGMDLGDPGRAMAIAALGVAYSRWSGDGGTGAPDLQQLLAALQAVVDDAGPDGSEMLRWAMAADQDFLAGIRASDLAQIWWDQAARLRRRVRPEDPKPLRLEVALSPATEPYAALLSALLGASPGGTVGVHLREDGRSTAPRWHWPIRVRLLDDPLSTTFASALQNTLPRGMGLADVLQPDEATRPVELLVLPWQLTESASRVKRADLQAPVACVVVLGGGQDLPWSDLRAAKDDLLATTRAAGVYVTELDPSQAAAWFNELGFNLAHNFQLDVAITSAWNGPNPQLTDQLATRPTSAGVFFATSELLAVSQLSSQVLAIADGFAGLHGNPELDVPAELNIHAGLLTAQEVAQQIRDQASALTYEHESGDGAALAGVGRALDEAQASFAARPNRAGFTHAKPPEPEQPTSAVGADDAGATDQRPPHRAYGLLDCPAEAVVGQPFEVVVGLSAEQARGVAGPLMPLPPLPGPAEEPYEVVVRIAARGFSFGPGESQRHSLRVSADDPYPSVPVTLIPTAVSERTERWITAMYYVGGELVGDAARSLAVVASDGDRTLPAATRSTAGVGELAPTGPRKADLTITILATLTKDTYHWSWESPHAVIIPAADPLEFSASGAEVFLGTVLKEVEATELAGVGRVHDDINGAARFVQKLLPVAVLDAIRAVATVMGGAPSIQLVSEEALIPWELAYLETPLVAGPAGPGMPALPPYLAAQARIGRWVKGYPVPPGTTRPKTAPQAKDVRSVAVVWGDYTGIDGFLDLPHARAEAKRFAKRYGAKHLLPNANTMSDLVNNLVEPAPDLIHFAVHGRWSQTGLESEGIILTDGTALTTLKVNGGTLGSAPFVFLNACQVGAGHVVLGQYSGMAAAFVAAGASCVIAPLWAIDDAVASVVSDTFYREIAAGEPPCEVLRKSRLDFSLDSKSATTMAYQFFGHPDLIVTGLPNGN